MSGETKANGAHPDRLLRLEEAAELLGLAPRTLYLRTREGHIPYVRIPGGRSKRYRLSSLLALIRESEHQQGGAWT